MATAETVAHEADCHGFDSDQGRETGACVDFCWGCCRCEPMREGDYRVCGECFHVFRTARELVEHYATALLLAEDEYPPADQIAVCPVCAHDF